MNKTTTPFPGQIAIQSWLRPALTPVPANVDYARFKRVLDDISAVLRGSTMEEQAIDLALEGWEDADAAQRVRRAQFAVQGLRLEVLRHLLGMPSYRRLSTLVCASDLLADFCGLLRLDGIRGASKSTVERRSKLFSEEQLRAMHRNLTEVVGNAEWAGQVGLQEAVPMDVCLVDSTCLEANIHYPTDWVLLGNVATTLLKGIKLVRGAGIVCRMAVSPEELAGQMNRLCMAMTQARRKPQAKKLRKAALRAMKRLLRTIGAHAQRHLEKLQREWSRTRFSEAQAGRIIARMKEKCAQIDPVIHRAHERIIGGRQVANEDKIISVHEPDLHVIVRGKAGAEVEFGNTLVLAETAQGYLTDYRLYREEAPGESQQLAESLQRQNSFDLEPIVAACTDRGFASKATSRLLARLQIYDATCPRSPDALRERMREERFRSLQKRRSGTEARIAILTNRWLGGRLRAKGYVNRARAVGWAVLSHNLWFIARKLAQQREKEQATEVA